METRTISLAPTRKQLATTLIMGANEVVRRAQQIADIDAGSDERENRLQLRAVRAERERDVGVRERDSALREGDQLALALRKVEGERDSALRDGDRLTLQLKKAERERDEALQAANQEKERRRVAERRLEATSKELEATSKELETVKRNPQHVPVPDVDELARQTAMVTLLETSLISRAAEALRRRATKKALVGVAAREQVFRAVTSGQQQFCRCFQVAQETLTTSTPLPDISTVPGLEAQVKRVLRALAVSQSVSLDSGTAGEYEVVEEVDWDLVERALRAGMSNPADYRVLEDSLCVDAHLTAQSRVAAGWRIAQDLPLALSQVVTAPPVARIETVTTEPATGSSKDACPPADAQ
eukprot:GHVT01031859.1.p1 GENE.GHVT01031859.1~~GHVT01031859.1.p1  ORF type:complete len:373 (+),score=39.82 GHVT01031859.1:51-1121(+)